MGFYRGKMSGWPRKTEQGYILIESSTFTGRGSRLNCRRLVSHEQMNNKMNILEKLAQKLLGMHVLVSQSVVTPPTASVFSYHFIA